MATTRSKLSPAQRRMVYRRMAFYRNEGTGAKGWIYQPHDYDASFALWSEACKTRREAVEAAYEEIATTPEPPYED